jgi:hypothetical protein
VLVLSEAVIVIDFLRHSRLLFEACFFEAGFFEALAKKNSEEE